MERRKFLEYLRERFDNYNPDEDPNGAIGMASADIAMEAFKNDPVKISRWYSLGIDDFADKKTSGGDK